MTVTFLFNERIKVIIVTITIINNNNNIIFSGLLVAYLTLKRFDQKGLMSLSDYALYLLHRYIR